MRSVDSCGSDRKAFAHDRPSDLGLTSDCLHRTFSGPSALQWPESG